MKAKMTVTKVELRNIKLTQNPKQIGHSFELVSTLNVEPRTMGKFSGDGIDCPVLQWFETIDWFQFDVQNNKWIHAGTQPRYKNLYAANPRSQTFKTWWEENRYAFARKVRGFPATLINTSNTEVKHWIAHHGGEWELPINDIPSMSLLSGTSGGAGASLVIGSTRRRIVRFELGFAGNPSRIHCAQILETVDGRPTINTFLQRKLHDKELADQQKLALWRNSVTSF